jgi:Fe-S-cluster containining protein
MCCNGVLFADVELGPDDSRDRLKELGVNLRRKGRKACFNQPCSQLQEDGLCGIYKDRPTMCAEFECGVLLRLASGEWSETQATAKIRKARRLERKVRKLLTLLGNTEENLALTKRYQKVMMEPIDCAGDEGLIEARGELMLAVQELMDLASRDFLALPDEE